MCAFSVHVSGGLGLSSYDTMSSRRHFCLFFFCFLSLLGRSESNGGRHERVDSTPLSSEAALFLQGAPAPAGAALAALHTVHLAFLCPGRPQP